MPTTKKPKLRIKKLRQVKAAILAHPEKYDQNQWCGTQACIAGQAVLMDGYKVRADPENWTVKVKAPSAPRHARYEEVCDTDFFMETGAKVLGLTQQQARVMFMQWPMKWKRRLGNALDDKARAQVAADFIEDRIAVWRK